MNSRSPKTPAKRPRSSITGSAGRPLSSTARTASSSVSFVLQHRRLAQGELGDRAGAHAYLSIT